MNVPPFLTELLLKSTLVLALAYAVLLLGRRLSAALRHLVAAVALVAAVLLPAFALLVPGIRVPALAGLLPRRASAERSVRDTASRREDPKTGETWRQEAPAPTAERAALPPTAETRSSSSSEPLSLPSTPVEWNALLAFLWGTGVIVVFSGSLAGTLRVRQLVRRATAVGDPAWLAAAAQLAPSLRLGKRRSGQVRLLHTEELSVPLTAGILKPLVLLPEEARAWSAERRDIVLLHELAHIGRRDCLALFVASLATALYWFHPLAWLVARSIREEGEKAADDLVLSAGVRASSYAGELLSFVRSLRFVEDEALPAMALAEGSHLSRRLRAVLDPACRRTAPSPTALRVAIGALLAVTATVAAVEPGLERSDRAKSKAVKAIAASPSVDFAVAAAPAVSSMAAPAVAPAVRAVALASPQVVFASRRNPRSGSEWYSRGMDLHHDERYDEAIAAFQKAIELGHNEGAASYNIACGYALKGDADHAFEWLHKAMDEGFDISGYMKSDDDLDSLKSDRRWPDLRKEARKGGHHEREAARAIARFQSLLSNPKENGHGLFEQGSKLLHADEYDKAATAFKTAAERGYRPSTSLYNLACALSLGGQKAAALDALQRSIEAGWSDSGHMDRDDDLDNIRNEPRFQELRDLSDDLELETSGDGFWGKWISGRPTTRQLREWRGAVERYNKHLAAHPGCGRAEFNLGYVYLKLEKPAEARAAFQKALDAGYRKPTTLYNIACAAARAGDKDGALDWLNRAMQAGFEGASTARHDDDLDSLRGDSRFRKLLREMEDRERDNDDKDDS